MSCALFFICLVGVIFFVIYAVTGDDDDEY